jgi:hypothetical protein
VGQTPAFAGSHVELMQRVFWNNDTAEGAWIGTVAKDAGELIITNSNPSRAIKMWRLCYPGPNKVGIPLNWKAQRIRELDKDLQRELSEETVRQSLSSRGRVRWLTQRLVEYSQWSAYATIN